MVQVNVQKRCSGNFHAMAHGSFDVLEIIKPLGTEQIYDEMVSRKPNAIALYEEVFSLFRRPRIVRRL